MVLSKRIVILLSFALLRTFSFGLLLSFHPAAYNYLNASKLFKRTTKTQGKNCERMDETNFKLFF